MFLNLLFVDILIKIPFRLAKTPLGGFYLSPQGGFLRQLPDTLITCLYYKFANRLHYIAIGKTKGIGFSPMPITVFLLVCIPCMLLIKKSLN